METIDLLFLGFGIGMFIFVLFLLSIVTLMLWMDFKGK